MKRVVTLLIILNQLTFSYGQNKVWSLNDCVNYGLNNSLLVKNSEISLNIADNELSSSMFNFLPTIEARAQSALNYGRSIDPSTNSFINTSFFNSSFGAYSSLSLFHGLENFFQLKMKKYGKEAAMFSNTDVIDKLAFRIMSIYFDVVYYSELLKIVEEQVVISEQNILKTNILIDKGLKSKSDLLEVKANYENEKLLKIQAQNNLQNSYILLIKEMNYKGDSLILIYKNEIETKNNDNIVKQYYNFDKLANNTPEILSLENKFMAAKKFLNIKRSYYYPHLYLFANYSTGYHNTNINNVTKKPYSFVNQIDNNQSSSFGIALNIPIFNRNQVRFNVKETKLNLLVQENNLNLSKMDMTLQIKQVVNESKYALQEIEHSVNQLEYDQLAFEAAQTKYTQGLINIYDLNMAKNRLGRTKSVLLKAKLTYQIKVRMLDYFENIRFWENN